VLHRRHHLPPLFHSFHLNPSSNSMNKRFYFTFLTTPIFSVSSFRFWHLSQCLYTTQEKKKHSDLSSLVLCFANLLLSFFSFNWIICCEFFLRSSELKLGNGKIRMNKWRNKKKSITRKKSSAKLFFVFSRVYTTFVVFLSDIFPWGFDLVEWRSKNFLFSPQASWNISCKRKINFHFLSSWQKTAGAKKDFANKLKCFGLKWRVRWWCEVETEISFMFSADAK
jgi:hypothetical protein